ncbi:MAG TPA: CHRD domain-containing protein [Rhizomicrobium sp.]|nr:CHRD domain-containing protein [Rhizomicrobium sp.]
MKLIGKALAAVLLLGCAQAAQAAPLFFRADLLGVNEVPPTGSPGTGTANVMIDPFTNQLKVDIIFNGLEANASASHIHCCTAPGTNTGVSVGFPGFPASTTGTYSHTFDLTQASIYTSAFLTASGGTAALAEDALIAGIEAGKGYVNIHDSIFPGGEIRGFLVSVPEPVTLSLFGAGLAGVAALRRRRKKS